MTTNQAFERFKENNVQSFEKYMLSHIESVSGTELEESMDYSLSAGGKRLRPLLLLAVLESFGADVELGFPAAAALEMIHTYSLVHDDLPAMDDDELRRGNPTNHIKFNEATAILAGDALLSLAFEVITLGNLPTDIKIQLSRILAQTSGYTGMVGGQQADIDGEDADLSLEKIEQIHLRKTGALIKMAMLSGGIIVRKSEDILEKLALYSDEVGIAYQIRDDILDVVGTEEELGKGVATDAALGKSTYPSLLGLDGAYKALDQRLDHAIQAIQSIAELDKDFQPELLSNFASMLALEEYK